MAWACFSWYIDGIVSADKYIDIPNENLKESILKMGLDEKWTLQ